MYGSEEAIPRYSSIFDAPPITLLKRVATSNNSRPAFSKHQPSVNRDNSFVHSRNHKCTKSSCLEMKIAMPFLSTSQQARRTQTPPLLRLSRIMSYRLSTLACSVSRGSPPHGLSLYCEPLPTFWSHLRSAWRFLDFLVTFLPILHFVAFHICDTHFH